MTISVEKVVSLSYQLSEANPPHNFIEEAPETDPLVFIFGIGMMLPAFEAHLTNKKVGDTFDFSLIAEDAYGLTNPEDIIDLPIEQFYIDGKLAEDLLVEGSFVTFRDENGVPHRARVVEVKKEVVNVDFNHPMAGMDLHFKGKILNIRPATPSELDHGHVHGPGGVEH